MPPSLITGSLSLTK